MDDNIRYSRQQTVDGIGREGQKRLREASVLVVGCGALGSVAATYLAAAGVGKLGLIDFDTIDVSNLQRQIMFRTDDVGRLKAEVLAERLSALNPGVGLETYLCPLTTDNAKSTFCGYDFIVDATDNSATKALVDRTAAKLGLPCVIGGVAGWRGMVTTPLPESPRWTDVFDEEAPAPGLGVMGPVPGIIGNILAIEAIKHLTGCGEVLAGRLFTIDTLTMTSQTFTI